MIKFRKKVDKCGKIFLPKVIVDNFGKDYFLIVTDNKIYLEPVKEEK